MSNCIEDVVAINGAYTLTFRIILLFFIFIVLFIGKPDLHDKLLEFITVEKNCTIEDIL